jgi:uncharacterized membrane protein
MSVGDVFLLIVRWLHLVSAAAWVGGSLFYLVVLRPAARRSPESAGRINTAVAVEFRALVDTCILVLLTTGIILTLNRLTPGVIGAPYAITLSTKIVLSIWMLLLARGRRRRAVLPAAHRETLAPASSGLQKVARALSGYNLLVLLGIVVFLLSDLLKVLYDAALS